MKEILFIVCTHGDETMPLEVMKGVISEYGLENWERKFELLIANPKALEKKVRYIDTDLNRVYPGNLDSELYEEKRAAEIFEYAKNFKCTIDIHTTTADTGLFTLITKNTEKNSALAKKMLPENIVIWESTSGRKTGPITSTIDNSCELECSIVKKEYENQLKQTVLNLILDKKSDPDEKKIYRVTGSINKNEVIDTKDISDFKEYNYKGKTVFPLLVNVYNDKLCYIMELKENLNSV